VPRGPEDEERLTADIIELARQYGRYGYRKIAGMLRDQAGWVVNDKRVERLWRRERLKVPRSNPDAGGCGSVTDRAFVFGRSTAIMSGLMTSWRIEPMTGGSTACST
jgi:helix-turn-helix protein